MSSNLLLNRGACADVTCKNRFVLHLDNKLNRYLSTSGCLRSGSPLSPAKRLFTLLDGSASYRSSLLKGMPSTRTS